MNRNFNEKDETLRKEKQPYVNTRKIQIENKGMEIKDDVAFGSEGVKQQV